MDRYILSPDDCIVLLAISRSSTLREAARLLHCDAGGLLRKVQRIAADHEVLIRNRGRWQLTVKGVALAGWTQETILSQSRLLRSDRTLRIASTSWFAERVLIPSTVQLKSQMPTSEIQFTVPAKGFEVALIEGDCDFVIVCHPPENPLIAHRRICPERWSLVVAAPAKNRARKLSIKDLSALPFIRHHDLNPASIAPFGDIVQATAFLSMDNLIGIRSAVLSGLGWSCVPTALMQNEIRSGSVIEVGRETRRDRDVCLWWLRGSPSINAATALEHWLRETCLEALE